MSSGSARSHEPLARSHAFIWWDSDQTQLSSRALTALVDPGSKLFFSIVSVWEMQIKAQLGKLTLQLPLRDLVDDHRRKRLLIAHLEVDDVLGLGELPMLHRDPFDRLIVSQALRGGYQLVTRDSLVASYGVPVVW